ncbi:ABC transporter ATP-binding protein [Williamsia sp.]|uniref:ABC transporter ATP-binding protein n=1 Tax=Williamsia sp. TaxID=1872085 RepID=UPI002F956C8B
MSLQVSGLIAGHGRVKIIHELDLDVPSGSVLAVLGPNGAGKSTLMMTLAGLLPRLGGSVAVDGHALPSGRAVSANRAGLVLVPDSRALFSSLSVQEHLSIARRKAGPTVAEIKELFPALEPRWQVAAGSLSGGEQQMLAIARALVQMPKVLLIDEMSMGLAPVIVEGLLPVVRRIAESTGATVILVEQHVRLALEVADQAIVMVHGEVTLRGSAAELRLAPERLETAYLGGDVVTAPERN